MSKLKYNLSGDGNKNRLESFIDVCKLRGIPWTMRYALLSIISYIVAPLWSEYYRKKYHKDNLPEDTFIFEKKKYKYFTHEYNWTWKSERAIEIALIKSYLDKYKNKRVLEIGNVYSHYFKINHDVVDNYEVADGVINEDVMTFMPKKKYDMIFSVSTLEHVGVDGEKEEGKSVKAVKLLSNHLTPNGIMLFTIPLGYNKNLDNAILSKKLKITQRYFFKKISSDNKWIQIEEKNAYRARYGFPFRWGNVVLLGIIKK